MRITLFGSTRRLALVTLACLGLASTAAAAGPTFADWLARQGTRQKDLNENNICGEPDVDQYVPATASSIYWTNYAQGRVAWVDFLGTSARALLDCGVDLGTTVDGSLSVRNAGSDQVLVSVRGRVKNALIYVADDSGHTFSSRALPLLCGAWEADVCEGATPSVADVEFNIQYFAPADQPIADVQWFGNPPPSGACGDPDDTFGFRFIMLRAHGNVTLADGSPGIAVINQTGLFMPHANPEHFDGFPAEFINVFPR